VFRTTWEIRNEFTPPEEEEEEEIVDDEETEADDAGDVEDEDEIPDDPTDPNPFPTEEEAVKYRQFIEKLQGLNRIWYLNETRQIRSLSGEIDTHGSPLHDCPISAVVGVRKLYASPFRAARILGMSNKMIDTLVFSADRSRGFRYSPRVRRHLLKACGLPPA